MQTLFNGKSYRLLHFIFSCPALQCRKSFTMVHPHTAVTWLTSYTIESGVVHQTSCCDCILSSPLSFIKCHVVTAFFHHLYRSPDVKLWLHSIVASIIITSSEFDSTDHYHYPPFISVVHSPAHSCSVSTWWCQHPAMNWPVSEDPELKNGNPCQNLHWRCAVTHATSPP